VTARKHIENRLVDVVELLDYTISRLCNQSQEGIG